MAESWIQVVKRVFKENRAKNPDFKLGQAMKIAKKIYKKTAKNKNFKNTEKNMRKTKNHNKGTHNYRKNRKY